jgi:hypothetical protein
VPTITTTIEKVFGPNDYGYVHVITPATGDQQLSTKKADLVVAVQGLVGQTAELEYTVKQNGSYTNYYLEKVTPVNGASPQPAAAAAEPTKMAENPQKAAEIRRSVALKAAVDLSPVMLAGDAPDGKPNLRVTNIILLSEQLAEYLEKGGDVLSGGAAQ